MHRLMHFITLRVILTCTKREKWFSVCYMWCDMTIKGCKWMALICDTHTCFNASWWLLSLLIFNLGGIQIWFVSHSFLYEIHHTLLSIPSLFIFYFDDEMVCVEYMLWHIHNVLIYYTWVHCDHYRKAVIRKS